MDSCGWFKHDWCEWGKLLDCYMQSDKQQSRVCNECGKVQVRSVKVYGQTNASEINKSMGIE